MAGGAGAACRKDARPGPLLDQACPEARRRLRGLRAARRDLRSRRDGDQPAASRRRDARLSPQAGGGRAFRHVRVHRGAGARRRRLSRRQAGNDALGFARSHRALRRHPGPRTIRARRQADDRRRGVTAGIDFGLKLLAELAGEDVAKAVQLLLEYAPAPPFDAGEPGAAPKPVPDAVRGRFRPILAERKRLVAEAARRLGRGGPAKGDAS